MTTTAPAPVATPAAAVPALARGPVFGIAGAAFALLVALSGRFGYFGDELYFLATGRWHLEWGYADNPWLLPLIARGIDAVFPDSVIALRLPAALLTAAGIVLTALIARELGGARRAQALAAGAYALSIQLLASGHILVTSTLDPFFWTLLTWLLVRWVRTRSDSLLLVAGLTTALAMQNKWLVPLLWIAVGAAALATGPRALLRRPALWLGALVTVAASIPTLLWQHAHDWPYLQMQQVVAEQVDRFMGGPALVVPLAVLFAGVPVGAFLACHGLWQLLRADDLRAYRFLGWAAVAVTVVVVLTSGRYYYLAGLYGLLFAVSAVRIERRPPARWWRWVPTLPVYLLSAVIAVPVALPVLPTAWVTTEQFVASSSLGWPQVAETVARAQRAESPGAPIVTETYWLAGALEVHGLREVYGVERGYWYLGRPPDRTDTVLFVGKDTSAAQLSEHFGTVRELARVRLDAKANNVNQGVRVWLCQQPRQPWPVLWHRLHRR